MGVVDEAITQMIGALKAWDFSPAFPSGYAGTKAVLITDAEPFDVLDNLLGEGTAGYMTQPMVAVRGVPVRDETRTLGEVVGKGAGITTRYGRRVWPTLTISAWADQTLGGNPTVEALGGQIQGCCMYNATRLAAIKGLWTESAGNAFEERPGLWRYDLIVRSYALVTYDA